MRILLTWLGNRDLENMEQDKPASIVTLATKAENAFDKIVILANKDDQKWDKFERFVKKQLNFARRPDQDVSVKSVRIKSPIDYESIRDETERWISKLSKEADVLSINLTSGTPAMTTLSVLIGKGKDNVEFLQSSPNNDVLKVSIPIDFGQTYIKSASKNLANAATSMPKAEKAFEDLTATSSAMKETVSKAKLVARSEVPVLVLGETGTGKELMAKAIHKGSLRADKPIRVVNCGAFSENLVDSTLFGHKRGAFTGADKDHKGLFEQADGGTLFLDEVGELSLSIQVKLLRALQEGEVTRLGDTKSINVDVRVIAATHQNLSRLVEEGKFREDLFYRLAVGIIEIPSLRQRQDDIPFIVEQLVEQINTSASKHPDYKSKKISENGMKFILSQPWKGNIRELWSTLNRAFLWSTDKVVTEQELASAIIKRPSKIEENEILLSLDDRVNIIDIIEDHKKKYILAALKASGNKKTTATQILGLKQHQTLTDWMKKLGIEVNK